MPETPEAATRYGEGKSSFLPDDLSARGARFSSDGHHRHVLWRTWDDCRRRLLYVLLNPSTADGEKDDMTIRRCRYFSEREGAGGMLVVNVFSFVATKPEDLKKYLRGVSVSGRELKDRESFFRENMRCVSEACRRADAVVVAWGKPPFASPAFKDMLSLLKSFSLPVLCLGLTTGGFPRHPSRVAGSAPLIPYPGASPVV